MHKNSNFLEQEDLKKLEDNDLIDKVAFILRSTILKMDKTTLPAVMKMKDLINGEYTIPEKLDRFFKALIGGKDIRRRDGVNCHRLSNSLASDAIYCVSNGTVKPSKHITLGMAVESLTSSRKMINILNRLGHCCNYNALEELETEATISSVNRSQICPPDIIQSPSLSTGVAFDNFDRYVDTLTGKDTLHDTVGTIYQNVSHDYDIELNSSSINGTIDIPLPPTKEDGLLTRKFQNYRRLIIDCKLNGLVEGKHFNRCKRLHPLMALGLKMLHFDPFLDNFEYNFLKEQVIDDLLHYQEVIDSHSSMPTELPNNVLSRVLSAYQKFVEETRQEPTNHFRAYTGETINSEAARCLKGIAHFTNSLAARQRWTESHSIRATIISHVLDVCGLKQLQDVSVDLQPNRIKIYGKQLSDFNEIFENNCNPFDEKV
ncbi:hypothetical protein TNCV_4761261 [Trichonephila clavipes]|uniref:Uncharacterized protein n=1 Tax=Trichonephila clavipes TaxID=2585209 RepID=A0A8X6RIL8_TRICX|nr:hypothetical protein TNCV_4761261 [Trichonephila clavipes]